MSERVDELIEQLERHVGTVEEFLPVGVLAPSGEIERRCLRALREQQQRIEELERDARWLRKRLAIFEPGTSTAEGLMRKHNT